MMNTEEFPVETRKGREGRTGEQGLGDSEAREAQASGAKYKSVLQNSGIKINSTLTQEDTYIEINTKKALREKCQFFNKDELLCYSLFYNPVLLCSKNSHFSHSRSPNCPAK